MPRMCRNLWRAFFHQQKRNIGIMTFRHWWQALYSQKYKIRNGKTPNRSPNLSFCTNWDLHSWNTLNFVKKLPVWDSTRRFLSSNTVICSSPCPLSISRSRNSEYIRNKGQECQRLVTLNPTSPDITQSFGLCINCKKY